MVNVDEKIEPIFQEVLRRNAGEQEFHQAVREVLESLGRVIAKHPRYLPRDEANSTPILVGIFAVDAIF
ncbi:hypothetical protein QO002_005949 [Pararhizobium capsulatum DSM 1112]|uniref:Glutamate dehydrogenase n=1 Tax=Pararhizobium capsulatum DSM 1112 TaxID=1121113 RepID=A0ABU0BZQ2_9HYPH|nr:hypothetical protein [Pararhizobium capsulatum DSM 1112]